MPIAVRKAIEEARRNPAAFTALLAGLTLPSLHRRILGHALTHRSWYAEIPRGHGKTTIGTYLAAWWIGARPSTRIKIVSQNDDAASATSSYIRRIVQSPLYRAVFPHITLGDDDRVMSWSVAYPGATPRRDPSVQASGVFGRTGGRADLLWLDDICDLRNAILQPALRGQLREAVANIWMPMLDPTQPNPPRVWRTATPWHTDDITADWRRSHGDDGSLLRCPVRGMESPWAEVFTPDLLRERRTEMGPVAFARAYELEPLSSDTMIFRPEWLRVWDAIMDRSAVSQTIAAIDWGYGQREQTGGDSDYSVCIVADITITRDIVVTDMIRSRDPFPIFAASSSALIERRRCNMVLAEANGPQRGIFDAFATQCPAPAHPVERTKDKLLRAAAAQPSVEQGKLILPGDQSGRVLDPFRPIHDEMVGFPVGAHDDTVDCIVDLIEYARTAGITGSGATTIASKRGRMFDAATVRRHRR